MLYVVLVNAHWASFTLLIKAADAETAIKIALDKYNQPENVSVVWKTLDISAANYEDGILFDDDEPYELPIDYDDDEFEEV